MASDTQITNGNEFQNGFSKVGKTQNYLFGFVGVLGAIYPMYDFLMDVEELGIEPTMFYQHADACLAEDGDGIALITNRQGYVWVLSPNGHVTPQPRGYAAIGSGGDFAIGALTHGASAIEAVNAAIRCDTGTSGRVVSETFSTKYLVRPDTISIDITS